jgi:hypothetical protein
LEQWRLACAQSQVRVDERRQRANVAAEHGRRIALVVAFWLIVALLTWLALA